MKRFFVSFVCVIMVLGILGCPKKPKLPELVKPEIEPEVETELDIRGNVFQLVPELKNIYFRYDKYEIADESKEILQKNADYLKDNKDLEILIAGHCCECGTNEYNLSLGQKRAGAVRDYYLKLGIGADRMGTISYGEEQPVNKNVGPPDSPDCIINRRAETKARAKLVK